MGYEYRAPWNEPKDEWCKVCGVMISCDGCECTNKPSAEDLAEEAAESFADAVNDR